MRLEQLNKKTVEAMSSKLEKALDSEIFFEDPDAIKKFLNISDQDIEELKQESFFYSKHQEWDKAIETLTYLTLFEPFCPGHFLRLGSLLEQVGNCKEAISIYELGSIIAVDDPRPHLYIGSCFCELKDFENAKKAFENCIEVIKGIPQNPKNQEIEEIAKESLRTLMNQ